MVVSNEMVRNENHFGPILRKIASMEHWWKIFGFSNSAVVES